MESKIAFSRNGAGSTGRLTCRRMQINLFLSLYKTQVQVNKGPPHKTKHTETNRKESGEVSWAHEDRGIFPE